MDASRKTLITGGVKSGKSGYALQYARKFGGRKVFISTAIAFDDIMRVKIKSHQQERDASFITVEEPVYLGDAIKKIKNEHKVIIIDCLTLWVNNLCYHFEDNADAINHQINLFQKELQTFNGTILVVTNEVGLGVMPDNALAQKYIDLLGRMNQITAQTCDEVIIMVSGIPLWVKTVRATGPVARTGVFL